MHITASPRNRPMTPASLRLSFSLLLPPLHSGGNLRLPFLRRFSSDHRSARPKCQKYETNPTKYWDDFYKRHHDKFFKDRHYLEKDWGHYFSECQSGDREQASVGPKVVLEVGCGVGNTLFPLLSAFPNVFVHACDFSPNAVALVKKNGAFVSDRSNVFICDVTKDDISKIINPSSVDIITMIFMLSAVSPVHMPAVLQNVRTVLKPNGYLLFRDYALGDFAQVKLASKGQMIKENFYARGDGTCAFFFPEDMLLNLFEINGLNVLDMSLYCKEIVNHSRDVVMDRRWVKATFRNVIQPYEPMGDYGSFNAEKSLFYFLTVGGSAVAIQLNELLMPHTKNCNAWILDLLYVAAHNYTVQLFPPFH